MKFIKDKRKELIIGAILGGQSRIVIDNIEILLKPLKMSFTFTKEQLADKQAESLMKILNS